MSCERLQSSSAQIAFSVSSNGFGSLNAVKHSGGVCCIVLKYFSLLVSDKSTKSNRLTRLARVLDFLQRSKCWPGWERIGIFHDLEPFVFVAFSCIIYTGSTFNKTE